MQFLWACPSCGSPLRVDTVNAGRKSRCPKCQAIMTLPASDPSVAGGDPPFAQLLPPKAPAAPIPAPKISAPKPQQAAPVARPAAPAAARPAGRRMLPPPRKPVPGADSPAQPVPVPELEDDTGFVPDSADSSFAPQEDESAESDFLSELATPSLGKTAPSASSREHLAAVNFKGAKGHRPAAKNQKWIWITTGGAAAVAVLVIVAILIFGGDNSKPTEAADAGSAAHTRKKEEPHQSKPESTSESPDAKVASTEKKPGDGDMLVADALPELKHWSTNVEAAERQAAKDKKDVLLVFFGPDNRQWCLKLAKDFLTNRDFRKYADSRYELVLLEAPIAGGNDSGRAAEMAKLAADYGVKSFPTMVLTDPEGAIYDLEEYQDVSVVEHLEKFVAGSTLRKERDKVLAPTLTGSDEARVDAAIVALKWMEKNGQVAVNAGRIHQWLELAEKVDPTNQSGKCEDFLLAELNMRLHDAKKDNSSEILVAIQPLDNWIKAGRKFKNDNAGAAFYLNLVIMLARAGDEKSADKYATNALDYHPTDPRLRAILGQIRQFATAVMSSGSGFAFAPGGYILTNNHVIEGAGRTFVRIAGDKKEYPAEVVSTSPELDVAVIKMVGQFPALNPLPLATATLPRGTEVVALGYPLPQDFGNIESITKEDLKLTQGPISAPPTPTEKFYVLDVKINHGNSGGPLVDMKGEVVGIVAAKTINGGVDNYGLAIPGKTVADYIETFKQKVPGYHSLSAKESAKLPELDKLTKVDALVSPSVVQIVKRRN